MPRRQLAWTADLKGLVVHYNAQGHDGHYDCCGDGRAPSRLEAQGGRTDPIRIARCRYRGSILRNAYSHQLIADYCAIADATCNAWNRLVAEPGQITSLCSYPWITTVNA